MNEACKRLIDIAKDSAQYSELLEGLLLQVKPTTQLIVWLLISSECGCVFFKFQGFYQLLEPKVTVRCRQQDVDLVQVRLI